jgi:hypothetical protein
MIRPFLVVLNLLASTASSILVANHNQPSPPIAVITDEASEPAWFPSPPSLLSSRPTQCDNARLVTRLLLARPHNGKQQQPRCDVGCSSITKPLVARRV